MDDAADPTTRLKNIIGKGVARLEAEMASIKPDDKKASAKTMAIVNSAAVLLGHVRRQEQADRAAGRGLTPATVIAYLRGLPVEVREHIRAEIDWDNDDGAPSESVLS